MTRSLCACSIVGLLVLQTPKPPVTTYDAKRDVTTYSTGDVHTAGYSGYSAHFDFPGKTPSAPSTVSLGFGSLRLTHGKPPDQDEKLLHWSQVKTVGISFGGKKQQYPAEHDYHVSTNKQVKMFLGRALEESLSISVTPAQFKELAASDSIQVELGEDVQVIKGKSLEPLKALAASLPASSSERS